MYCFSFSLESFMQDFWQKKPTIIKQGFNHFKDPLSPDELAGLAMESEIDSRLIDNKAGHWHAEHGPFTEEQLTQLGETNSSIIVQAVNHWHEQAAQLIKPFKQIPHWLFDDLMISFATPDGGVGPHIDQYDVFICQGLGKRHWRVGAKDEGQYQENIRHPALKQIDHFEPIIDDILETGDILYIPAGFPHDGYALTPSMSYSVGYRSPKSQELISNFADFVLAHDRGDEHLLNPAQNLQSNKGALTQTDMSHLVKMLKSDLEDAPFIEQFLGCLLSQSRHQLNIIPMQTPYTNAQVLDLIHSGALLHKVLGLRCYYHEKAPSTVYINGEVFQLTESDLSFIQLFIEEDALSCVQLSLYTNQISAIEFITLLLNKGYLYHEDFS